MKNNSLVYIGRITKPHGVRGTLKVYAALPESADVSDIKNIWCYDPDESLRGQYSVQKITWKNSVELLLTLSEITDMNGAEALRNTLVYAQKNEVNLPQNANYTEDLIGCRAVCLETGESIGTLLQIQTYPAHDVYVFDTPKGEMLLPALLRIVPAVDAEKKIIYISEKGLKESAVWQA